MKLDSLPTDVVAGETTTIGFTVLQHGDHPLPNLDARITAKNAGTGEQLLFEAKDEGKPGTIKRRYHSPTDGVWESS